MNALESDVQIGKYRLIREIGAGGMGSVWLAHDTELDRKVALKVLRPALAGDDTAQARLLREARAMAKLRHPNVITVFDAESIGGRDLVAMELVDGENMAAWLTHEHTVEQIAETLLAAGRGLAAAHAAGMVHRDFKPHNVLVERGGRVLVTDFGLARAEAGNDALMSTVEARPASGEAPAVAAAPSVPKDLALEETAQSTPGPKPIELTQTSPGRTTGGSSKTSSKGSLDSDLTRTGTLLGTPAYMAPEQIAGRPADARADQFAFCITAWEALAGKRPFPGDDVGAIAKAIERGVPSHADKIPRGLRPLLQRGLAADPAKRWPAMDPLLAAFDRAVRRPKQVKQWSQAIGLGVFAFVAIFVVMSFVSRDKKPAETGCDATAALARSYKRDEVAKLLTDRRALGQLD
ncbi:MAG: serine/threonine protein kinase, partial [Deltaproteobacteria bacterium]|nr:serine/threonine protein kinase [Deltaproteobacteria bacterium]